MKEKYEEIELEIIRFLTNDIITTSGYEGVKDDDELPFVHKH